MTLLRKRSLRWNVFLDVVQGLKALSSYSVSSENLLSIVTGSEGAEARWP